MFNKSLSIVCSVSERSVRRRRPEGSVRRARVKRACVVGTETGGLLASTLRFYSTNIRHIVTNIMTFVTT